MGLLELFLIAVGLSMDAFAVSVCKGLSVRTLKAKHAVICEAEARAHGRRLFRRFSDAHAAHRLRARRALSVAHHKH